MQTELICAKCNSSYSSSEIIWRCKCGGLLDINFDAKFPIDKIVKRKTSIWRYKEALPVSDTKKISFAEGFTPLEETKLYDIPVLVKHDYLFPTASFKDRGASMLISKIVDLGVKNIVEDSSGNAGTSIAAYAAKAGIRCTILTPLTTSKSKQNQIITYGAELELVDGNREKVAAEAIEIAERSYYASHCWNPYFFQGVKTIAFEIVEQLGWKAPDSVILPLGNGTLVIGAYLGFKDLQKAGIINTLPRILAVQAENCAPVYNAMNDIQDPIYSKTLAEGISIEKPIRFDQIINAIEDSNGQVYSISDKEINSALKYLYSKGYYVEPTSAIAVAALKKIDSNQYGKSNVVVLTGHGLKYIFSQL